MKLKLQRQYLPILAEFMAKEDVRYYLNGFHIKPHSQGGVILTATNGHIVVVIHDKLGESDGSYILPISATLKAAAKKKTVSYRLELNAFQVIGNRAYLYHADDEFGYLIDAPDYNVECLVAHTEYISQIDGRFPNAGRMFDQIKPEAVARMAFNPHYLAQLKHLVGSQLGAGVEFMFCGDTKAAICLAGQDREIAAMIMPMHIEHLDDHSFDFAREAGTSTLKANAEDKEPEHV